MKRSMVILSLLAVCTAGAKPNILYINADDLGVMDVSFNSDRYRTPNIDRLRKQGMLFTDAYAPSANCAPSRAAVFSGQYSPRHGVYTVGNSDRGNAKHRRIIPIKNTEYLPDEMLTLAEALKAGGYRTIHLGKWHLGEDPTTQGFDINIGGGKSGSPYGGYFAPFRGPMESWGEQYGKGAHSGDIFADQAVQFLQKYGGKGPFFMHMAYYLVHTPLQPVPGLVEKYRDEEVHAAYASMIEKMDQSIGMILAALEEQGLADNTLVLFCSDNGGICKTSSQAPFRAGKGSYFEGGVREPLVVRWPGKVKPDSTCHVPVIGLDFFPTFLDAAGLPVPEGKILDGVSLMPLLTQSGSIPERTLYWHFPIYLQKYGGVSDESHDPLFRTRPGSALRDGKWKLHEYFEDGRLELYDLEADTGERVNLADRYPEKAAELHARLKAWRKELNAPVPTAPNPKFDAEAEAEVIKKQQEKNK